MTDEIVQLEWESFQDVQAMGERPSCQDDYETFRIMRSSQFKTWPDALRHSYRNDLRNAQSTDRNLIYEKYAWMMIETDPLYVMSIRHTLPYLTQSTLNTVETIVSQEVLWKKAFNAAYPALGSRSRVIESREDTADETSFETYLRGELYTYSQQTLALYHGFVQECLKNGINLIENTMAETLQYYGYRTLKEAEKAINGHE